jgi:uncharacterized protein (DUF1330 family)
MELLKESSWSKTVFQRIPDGKHIFPYKIYITQLIYIKPGQENVFDQFEDIAIPTILKYNGKLLLRVRPDNHSFIEHHIDKPYEIHLVEFDSEGDFKNFMQDEERKKFLHLKEQSITSIVLIQGKKYVSS